MSDNNADYNGSGQDEYFATNDSTQADYRQSQDGYNQPASQPHNPNPYASQQPVQGYAPVHIRGARVIRKIDFHR